MSFLGFYNEKEVEEIKEKFNKNYEILKSCKDVEINSLKIEKENLLEEIEEINEEYSKIIEDKDKEIFVLKTLLYYDADKEINRLERIAKRTKKIRVKKKCESSILDYKMRKMAYGQ